MLCSVRIHTYIHTEHIITNQIFGFKKKIRLLLRKQINVNEIEQ